MIPARIRQIVKATAIVAALLLPCFLAYDRGAGIAFGVTSAWMIANLLIWALVMRLALQPGDAKPPIGVLLMALTTKLFLLIGGYIALRVFAPYTKLQLYAIIAGVSSVLLIAFLKALGSKVATLVKSTPSTQVEKKRAAKV